MPELEKEPINPDAELQQITEEIITQRIREMIWGDPQNRISDYLKGTEREQAIALIKAEIKKQAEQAIQEYKEQKDRDPFFRVVQILGEKKQLFEGQEGTISFEEQIKRLLGTREKVKDLIKDNYQEHDVIILDTNNDAKIFELLKAFDAISPEENNLRALLKKLPNPEAKYFEQLEQQGYPDEPFLRGKMLKDEQSVSGVTFIGLKSGKIKGLYFNGTPVMAGEGSDNKRWLLRLVFTQEALKGTDSGFKKLKL